MKNEVQENPTTRMKRTKSAFTIKGPTDSTKEKFLGLSPHPSSDDIDYLPP